MFKFLKIKILDFNKNLKLKIKNSQGGFTITELMVVIGIITTLLGLTAINLLGSRNKASLASTIDPLVADIKQHQIKAMVGDTEGQATAYSFGVRFETTRYILFRGTTYSSTDSANFTVDLDNSVNFENITFSTAQIVFAQGSGEINGFTSGSNTVKVRNIRSNDQKTITINRYGVITSIN